MNDDEEMLEIAQSLRREFDELGEVTDVTKKRLKEILEDKNKREVCRSSHQRRRSN